jgi:hypothetical protein
VGFCGVLTTYTMETPDTCYYCGQPATLLCDGVLGYGYELDRGRKVMTTHTPVYTCDRALCQRCAVISSPIFFDGTNPDGTRWGEIDSHDYCRACNNEGRHPGRYLHGNPNGVLWCSPEDGVRRQRQRQEGAARPAHLRLIQ